MSTERAVRLNNLKESLRKKQALLCNKLDVVGPHKSKKINLINKTH